MTTIELHSDIQPMQAEKRRVALNSIYVALVITTLKVVVGYRTRSLGILSEAAHSGLDLLAAGITLLSVRVSDKPADADHQYGHGKFENFSAFLETGLLLLTCVFIVWEAIQRLLYHTTHIAPTVYAFAVMFLSMVLDFWRSRRLKTIATKYQSQALEADALHFSTDIWSSGVVILGLALVLIGERYQVPMLAKADPIAALLVAMVIVYVSSRLARETIDALLDASPGEARARIINDLQKMEGVLDVDRVRIRRAGNRYFADVSVALPHNATFRRSEQIASSVTGAVQAVLPNADVTVHSFPRLSAAETIFDKIRTVAARNNFNVHDVSVQELGGKLHVEQHLELDEKLTLKEGHDIVTQLEAEIRAGVPEIDSILTHIESEPNTIESGDEVLRDAKLEKKLRKVVGEFPEIFDVHEIKVKKVRDLLYLSCHCTMADELPLSRVHDISTALEIRFKQESPELFKVLIHTEPQTDNTR